MSGKTQIIEEVREIDESIANEVYDEDTANVLRAIWESSPTPQNCFQYAAVLRHSKAVPKRDFAIKLFKSVANERELSRDAFYYIALTYYSLEDYRSALHYIEELFRADPDNDQIKILYTAIRHKYQTQQIEKDNSDMIKVGLGVGAAAAGLALAISYLRGKNSS